MQKTIALASLLFIGACVAGDEDSLNLNSAESHIESANRLSSNRLSSNRLSSNRLSSNRLSSNGLAAGSDLQATVDDEGGREFLTYMVSCALADDQSVTLTSTSGVEYQFAGSIGLATNWVNAGMTDDERRWVSACLLSRVNYYGVTVPISMRGSHPALAAGADERAAYGVREGAFFGNLFDPNGVLYACDGPDKHAGSTAGWLSKRECTFSDDGTTTRCGFAYAGTCESVCQIDASGNYVNCGGDPNTITVFLENP